MNSPANITSQKSKSGFSFGAGWNSKISEEIKCCDVRHITKEMAEHGIEADFADNKVVAWCCNQAVKKFNHLNDKYGLKLDLPKGIYVKDFSTLNIDNEEKICFM